MKLRIAFAEIAQAALFLASGESDYKGRCVCAYSSHDIGIDADESSYINGQNVTVDGGLTASLPVIPGKFA